MSPGSLDTSGLLVLMNKTVVRTVLDYCAVVYHPILTDEMDQKVERMLAQTLKNIYGYRVSYTEMRKREGVTTHRVRHINSAINLQQKRLATLVLLTDFFRGRQPTGGETTSSITSTQQV